MLAPLQTMINAARVLGSAAKITAHIAAHSVPATGNAEWLGELLPRIEAHGFKKSFPKADYSGYMPSISMTHVDSEGAHTDDDNDMGDGGWLFQKEEMVGGKILKTWVAVIVPGAGTPIIDPETGATTGYLVDPDQAPGSPTDAKIKIAQLWGGEIKVIDKQSVSTWMGGGEEAGKIERYIGKYDNRPIGALKHAPALMHLANVH